MTNNKFKDYWGVSDGEKIEILRDAYWENGMSWIEISKELNTYPNKVRREAKRLNIPSRDKSAAQKTALGSGRAVHPTEGKAIPEDTRLKISESQGIVWDSLTDEERLVRSQIGKMSWDKKTEEEKRDLIRKGGDAIRQASKKGSKLERFLLEELSRRKYRVQFHKEHWLKNQNLETDLFIEDLNTVIEVDGPSHFSPVWGEDNLVKNVKSDMEKTGLILDQGLVLIRIKQSKRISQRYLRNVLEDLLKVLSEIKDKFPRKSKRYIEI